MHIDSIVGKVYRMGDEYNKYCVACREQGIEPKDFESWMTLVLSPMVTIADAR